MLPNVNVEANIDVTGNKEMDEAVKEVAKKILSREQILAIMPEFQFKLN